jgi:uncharacterized membrane protein
MDTLPSLAHIPLFDAMATVAARQTFLSIVVLVSQNRQSEHHRIRTDLDYQAPATERSVL